MTTRYYEETPDPCGQDRMGEHWIDPLLGKDGLCPGGQRRELTDVWTVRVNPIEADGSLDEPWLVTPYAGRFAIIPLEEPADG